MKRKIKLQNRNIFKNILIYILIVALTIIFTSNVSGCKKNLETEPSIVVTEEDVSEVLIDSENAIKKGEEITVNIGSLKGPTSIGMLKIHKEKPLLGDGVFTNYEIIASPDIMISKLLAGEMDMAALPTNVAAKLYNKGFDIKLAAITGYGVLYMLYQDTVINGWMDLKDKKVQVVSKGSTPDVLFRYLLAENNLEAEIDLELDYSIEQIELAQLMVAGKTGIAILPEPFVTLVVNKNENVEIGFDIEAEWKKIKDGAPLPMSCLVVRSGLAEKNKNIIDEFLLQYRQSIDWVNKNPSDAADIVTEIDIGMDSQTAIDAIPRCNIKFTPVAQARESINIYINTILDFSPEDVGGKMPDENFYY